MKRNLILPTGLLVAASNGIVLAEDETAARVEPIITSVAQTARKITLKGTSSYFDGIELQENVYG